MCRSGFKGTGDIVTHSGERIYYHHPESVYCHRGAEQAGHCGHKWRCPGGGTELALACDIRIASSSATMGLTETRLAIIPGAGGTQRLPRLVGKGKAKELIFMGRRIDAAEALKIGLVNRTCQPELLMGEAIAMAETICEAGPIAIEQAKYAINCGLETDLHTGLAIESNAYWITIPTEDRLEGLAAFREKRKPVYKGK